MVVCDICEKSVATYSLSTNKVVYGLLPVEADSVGYSKAAWVDTDDGSGMTKFIHDGCLSDLIEYSIERKSIPPTNDQHEHEFYFSSYCGVNICTICEFHKELARCYCGWSASGGDGYQELMEMGD